MVATKKPARKRRIQASEIDVETRSFLAVLDDMRERSMRAEERSARAEEIAAEAAKRSAQAEQSAAESMRRFDMLWPATQAMLRDLMALGEDFRAHRDRIEGRVDALEKVAAE